MKNVIIFLSLVGLVFGGTIIIKKADSNTITESYATTTTDTTNSYQIYDDNEVVILTTHISSGTGYANIDVQGKVAGNWVTMAEDSVASVDPYGQLAFRVYQDSIDVPVEEFRLIRAVTVSSGTVTIGNQISAW